jgi:hypothetical protein
MKILGKTSDGYIAELTKAEMAWVQGFRSKYDNKLLPPEVGDVVDIRKFVETSAFVRELDTSRLQKIADQLTNALASVEEARLQAGALTLFETLKQDSVD